MDNSAQVAQFEGVVLAEEKETHRRLGAIEIKLDKLQEAMLVIARVEERLTNNQEGMFRLGSKMDRVEDDLIELKQRLNNIDHLISKNSALAKVMGRAGWLAFGAIISSAVVIVTAYIK